MEAIAFSINRYPIKALQGAAAFRQSIVVGDREGICITDRSRFHSVAPLPESCQKQFRVGLGRFELAHKNFHGFDSG